MDDNRIWYLYQNQKQMGPFDIDQVQQLFTNSMIAQDAYVFKVGWKDWRPIEETYDDLGVPPIGGSGAASSDNARLEQRKASAPRASIKGRVEVHNGASFSSGIGVNISSSGIFVETRDRIFEIGERLKLTVRVDGLAKAFNVVAKVIRFNSDDNYAVGYGLKFEDLSEAVRFEIEQLIHSSGKLERKPIAGTL